MPHKVTYRRSEIIEEISGPDMILNMVSSLHFQTSDKLTDERIAPEVTLFSFPTGQSLASAIPNFPSGVLMHTMPGSVRARSLQSGREKPLTLDTRPIAICIFYSDDSLVLQCMKQEQADKKTS